ncbi:nucleotidyltransferase family protein [Granulicella arctica]|uniref:Nucleotidyltransferase family protein n=1 Tax=Granulicella arctica TaxID=940613 RepID=A0A7Y9PEW2_9BACT|nr:nucleotidyltransferase family protein [Granulicella arctica]NYF78404.1 hypothetical protein [Granulicella arctica]
MASTPEMRLLAECLPPHSGAGRDLTQDLTSIDWTRLFELAAWHGMFPLLASRLLSSSPPSASQAIPAPVISMLQEHQAKYLHRSLIQTLALVQLQREFDSHGITVLAWKGPSVGWLLYGSAALRDSSDLDFLFREEDLQQVMSVTRRLGYRLLESSDTESKDLYIFTLHREFSFARPTESLLIEFHLQIMPARFHLWQDAQKDIERADIPWPLADVELRIQRPDDLLVSLCAHATKHYWDRLKWCCDIAQFLHVYRDKLDWPALLLALRKSKKDSVVLLGLAVTANIYSLKLPSIAVEALQRAPKIVALAEDLVAHVMSGQTDSISTRAKRAPISLLCPRLRDRIFYAVQPLVELNYEDLFVPVHNRPLFFINYLFRIVRLLKKYGPQRLVTKTAVAARSVR